MYCNYCGQPIPNGNAFCPNCGTAVQQTTQSEQQSGFGNVENTTPYVAASEQQDAAQAPVVNAESVNPYVAASEQQDTAQAPGVNAESVQEQSASFQFSTPEMNGEPPKKSFWSRLLRSKAFWISASALTVVLLVVFNFSFLKGLFVKTFGDEKDYLAYAEENSFKDASGGIADVYGSLLEILTDGISSDVDVTFRVSDDALSLVNDYTDSEIDLDWINSLSLGSSIRFDGQRAKAEYRLGLNETQIVNAEALFAIDEGMAYLGVPGLNEKYLSVEFEFPQEALDALADLKSLVEAMPSEKDVDELLFKYFKLAMDQIEDVSESSETLEVNGVSQKVTVLEYEISEELAYKMCLAIVTELQEDKEAAKMVEELSEYLEKEGLIESADDVMEGYEEALEALMDSMDSVDSDDLSDEGFTMVDYVDSNHVIVGRAIVVDGDEMFSFATAKKGNKFAYEMKAMEGDTFLLSGEGTDKGGKINGEFELEVRGAKLATIEVSDFESEEIEDGKFKGTFRIAPSKDLLSELAGSMGSVISALDIGLEFTFDCDEKSSVIDVKLLQKNTEYLGINIAAKINKVETIGLPDEDDCLDAAEAEEWVTGFDFDALMDSLDEAGVDESLLEMIGETISNFI